MKNKKEITHPIEFSLKDTICVQLKLAGYFCEIGSFSDKSASWINVFKEDNEARKKPGSILSLVIAFNYEGTIITQIKLYQEKFFLQAGETLTVW